MKARSKEILGRAIAAMLAAVEIYNKPAFPYRAESFTILSVNAWELLLKAKWLADRGNRLSSLYVRLGGGSKRKRIKKTAAGNPMTYGLDYLSGRLHEAKVLDEHAHRNLKILAELRDSAVHYYHQSPKLEMQLQEVGAAAVKNFRTAVDDWFKDALSTYNIFIMPIAFVGPRTMRAAVANYEEKRLMKFVADQVVSDDNSDSRYSVAVNVELRFVRSKSQDAIAIRLSSDPNAQAVRFTEEQIRDRYPWDYWELTTQCKERYSDFKIDRKYHGIRKGLESDQRFAHVRRLDPENPKSPTKVFFSTSILEKFDKECGRKI